MKCGFCITDVHSKCLGTYQLWVAEYVGKRGKKKFEIVYLDKYRTCSCPDSSHKEE